jgi:hypothetical protein
MYIDYFFKTYDLEKKVAISLEENNAISLQRQLMLFVCFCSNTNDDALQEQ